MKKIQKISDKKSEMLSYDMPPVSEYLKQKTKNTTANIAPQIYEETWDWLSERNCAHLIKKELLEQYSLITARWVQCEEGINMYGLLAKHPTTKMPIASPYVNMSLNFLKQANETWAKIIQIVNEHQDDNEIEKILTGKL